MAHAIKIKNGEITLNGVAGFRIEKTIIRVFDGRGKIDGWKIVHATYGKMNMIGEDRAALLKKFARAAGANPNAFAEKQFVLETGYTALNDRMNRMIGR